MKRKWTAEFQQHRYGLTLVAFLTAALLTGVACVMFARAFDWAIDHRWDFDSVGRWAWVSTPIGFLIAVEVIRRWAPFAAGTGIPQAIYAAEALSPSSEKELYPLVSLWTVAIKVLTLLLGIWVGASTGREGPTVHVAVGVFFGVVLLFRRAFGLDFDRRSAVIAGGAAGLAAAFNTPLAGVTFAVEELSENYFASVKDIVLMAIIVAAVMAQVLTGEYGYFGKLSDPVPVPFYGTLAIGLLGGGCGIGFGWLLMTGSTWLKSHQHPASRYTIPVGMSFLLLLVAAWAGTGTLGSGNRMAQDLLNGTRTNGFTSYPIAKMATTLFTYWAGLSGGIFAPCLSMGAALGAQIGQWMQMPVASCALVGMAAFLCGAIQAPMTSFVIIYEMTGHHHMLLPLMVSSLTAFMLARFLKAPHLYKMLAAVYGTVHADKSH